MSLFHDLFFKPYPASAHAEVTRLLDELVDIGKREDFLAERFTPGFNLQLRHIRAREIGERLNAIGGRALMEYAYRHVARKAGRVLADHLEYAWAEIGDWLR